MERTPEEEARAILSLHGGDYAASVSLVERQLNVLHTRAQVLVSFAGIVVTVTGFSGRLIAATDPLGQWSIIAGLVTVLVAAFWIFTKVMSIHWVSSRFIGPDPSAALTRMLEYRNAKTRAYRQGGYIMFAGLALYALAISLMLSNPVPITVPVR